MFGIILPKDWAKSQGFEIWEENAPALEAFLEIDTQWCAVSRGNGGLQWIGLDYGRVRDGLALAGIEITPQTWADLRLIEAGATEELNKA